MINKEVLKNFTLEFTLREGAGPVAFSKLLSKHETIENFYLRYKIDKLAKLKGSFTKAEELQNKLAEQRIGFVCVWEEEYPFLLKQINDPPILLYYKGEFTQEIFRNCISIVGTRKYTSYGQKMTKEFARELAYKGITIVSGMASGIDAFAHIGALESNGRTIAVLAGSPGDPTPKSNTNLYKDILGNGGLILSEYPPLTEIQPGMFVRRNRIVAGLSRATIVTEAGIESGAIITANLANDYNRDVFALPGDINRDGSKGVNQLIKENKAKLVESSQDVLLEMGIVTNRSEKDVSEEVKSLGVFEKKVYSAILSGAKTIDELKRELGTDLKCLVSAVSLMEIMGILYKRENGSYSIS